MEEELRCPSCHHFFNNAVLLPCYHAVCLNCALQSQTPVNPSQSTAASAGENDSSVSETTDSNEIDQVSVLSETDSGVVCSSRPSSYVGTPSLQSLVPPAAVHNVSFALTCPQAVCKKTVYFDDNGVNNLPPFRAMQNIVDKYCESKNMGIHCQLCEGEGVREAAIFCEQCEVFYCDVCKESCHPARGPLAKHSLVLPKQGKTLLRNRLAQRARAEMGHCPEHAEEMLALYCNYCKLPACDSCTQEGRHSNHDVQSIVSVCKAYKTELSQALQQLSEKARAATELIQRIKYASDKLHESSACVESVIGEECEALISLIRARQAALIEYVRQEKENRLLRYKEHVAQCTSHLQKTTGLLHFSIEALKETDPNAFLQIGSHLSDRVLMVDRTWESDMQNLATRITAQLDLTLDVQPVQRAVEHLTFVQMKPQGSHKAPERPNFIVEECSAENNSMTVAWQPTPASFVEGYVLELDDGHAGPFREVYCGKETVCTVDGLHFNCLYHVRVKAFNGAGEGPYSEPLALHTAEVAWFTLDGVMCPPEARLSGDRCTVSAETFEPCVILGSVGFSRGIHYWEFTVDRLDGTADPAFGVARRDVSKSGLLGQDDKAWAMYIDAERSWFLHDNVHTQRCAGGIEVGSTVGVLLDLERRYLAFYVNDEPQGPVAFTDMHGVFFPAVSVNRNVTISLHTALDPPTSLPDSGEGSGNETEAEEVVERRESAL